MTSSSAAVRHPGKAPLLIVGDSLLDRDLEGRAGRLAPDAPVPVVEHVCERSRPGGAALAAVLATRDGRDVTFVSALADDAAGRAVAALLHGAGVRLLDLTAAGPTGEKVRIRAAGQPLLRLDHGGSTDQVAAPGDEVVAQLRSAPTILVSDYGRGVTAQPQVRAAITDAAARGARVVWDPHPRGPAPTPMTRVATPNLAEAQHATGAGDADEVAAVADIANRLRDVWGAAGVAVTLGARGALLVSGDGTPLVIPARRLTGQQDPCGAGDRFAVSVAGAIADGAVLSEAVVEGVRAATAFVADGGAGALDERAATAPGSPAERPRPAPDAVEDLVAATRARGGTVVATGGCFDLLHAGHVRLLADARGLGDCLVVCVNSDASVRRIKGPGRPVVSEDDRRAVLMGLTAVDAVVVFDEDTPERVLSRLRPDLWVKGGDYAVADLPEAPLVASWGGRAVTLPYLDGRSTSALIQEAVRHARN